MVVVDGKLVFSLVGEVNSPELGITRWNYYTIEKRNGSIESVVGI